MLHYCSVVAVSVCPRFFKIKITMTFLLIWLTVGPMVHWLTSIDKTKNGNIENSNGNRTNITNKRNSSEDKIIFLEQPYWRCTKIGIGTLINSNNTISENNHNRDIILKSSTAQLSSSSDQHHARPGPPVDGFSVLRSMLQVVQWECEPPHQPGLRTHSVQTVPIQAAAEQVPLWSEPHQLWHWQAARQLRLAAADWCSHTGQSDWRRGYCGGCVGL